MTPAEIRDLRESLGLNRHRFSHQREVYLTRLSSQQQADQKPEYSGPPELRPWTADCEETLLWYTEVKGWSLEPVARELNRDPEDVRHRYLQLGRIGLIRAYRAHQGLPKGARHA